MARRWITIIFLLIFLASAWIIPQTTQARAPIAAAIQAKHLGGPADELTAQRLPDARAAGTRSAYTLVDVRFDPAKGNTWSGDLMIDRGESVAFFLISPESKAWNVQLTAPDDQRYGLAELSEQSGGRHETSSIGMEEAQYPAEVYTVHRVPAGRWQVTISSDAAADGVLAVAPESSYGLYSYLTTTALVAGQPIGVGAYFYSEPLPSEPPPTEKEDQEPELPRATRDAPAPLAEVALTGEVVLRAPDGKTTTLPLADDGQQGDQKPGDGRAELVLPPLEPGTYQALIHMRGVLADGTPVERSGEEIIPVLRAPLTLTGAAAGRVLDEQRLAIEVEARVAGALPESVLVYAEVWGTSDKGELIPAGWSSGMVTPATPDGERTQMTLEFDGRWLALAGVRAPLLLRAVRVQDPDTLIPLTSADEVRVEVAELPKGAFADPSTIDPNDPELRMGRPQPAGESAAASPARAGGAGLLMRPLPAPVAQQATDGILLVHGYCSGPVWPTSQFSRGPTRVFSDYNQNRSHNTFAQLIRQQGNALFSQAFSIVAHSQGGAAALHLYTYYWSNLDNSQAPRRIQTVGTPYWGSQLAGLIAWLGQIFNAGCGPNWDLTPLGSALWQSGIPLWARNQVSYATTAHGHWWIFESICHASSFILPGIDDGVVSVAYGQLWGGNNLGMKRDWCHSGSMVYTAHYLDSARNDEMDLYGRSLTDVGVIPAGASCPQPQNLVTIYMDDEDHNNANGRGGWIGATTSNSNTTFRFCRVSGQNFRPLTTTSQPQRYYAVLKLGTLCPNGSLEFARSFDNEDNNNQNWSSNNIAPNVSDRNTTLRFCLFRSGATTMGAFPNLGMSYGVFAASGFSLALATGYVHTDDEDHNNANGYWAGAGYLADAQQIVSGGGNTTLNMARVN